MLLVGHGQNEYIVVAGDEGVVKLLAGSSIEFVVYPVKLVVESDTKGVVEVEYVVIDNVDASADSLVDVPYELVDWDKYG
ncbi:unnamed protein product [Meloidogyne enterolobii]|uniref:Uncharacterized protein n=1 Tax=Meloidogyne enterolobii TaxID=390850 RepID=A0ACB1B5U0_MELEN